MTGGRLITTGQGTNRNAFTAVDWLLFIGLSTIWGASFLFISIGLDFFHPGLVTWLRVGFGAMFLLTLPRARTTPIAPRDRGRIRFIGIIWVAIPMTLFPIAQQWVDSSVAGMLNGTVPIFTAIIASVLLRRLPGRLQAAGLVLGSLGIVAITVPSSSGGATAALGVALILVATVCYGFANNVVTPVQQAYGSIRVIAEAQRSALILVTPYGIYGLVHSQFAWSSLLATLTLGALGTGLAFVMMASLAGRVGPTRASFITYIIPVIALGLGVVFRAETLAPAAVGGAAMVILGALLASRRET